MHMSKETMWYNALIDQFEADRAYEKKMREWFPLYEYWRYDGE